LPLYEYRCTQCGHRFEKIQHFNAEPETKCPKCGGELMRPLTAPAFQFKGAGWYVNDYSGKGGSSSADDKPAAKAEGGEKKTDAKPAATESATKPAESKPAASAPSSSSSSSSE
jgi:putative FmdB family regulatory protein